MTRPYRSCRAETVEVDGVRFVALVRGNDELTDTDRTRMAAQVRDARARARERTTLVPLPTKFSIGRALAGLVPDRDRRAAARAVHDLLTGPEAWVTVDAVPLLEPGDLVAVTWVDGAGRDRAGEGVVVQPDETRPQLLVQLARPDTTPRGT